MFFNKSFGKTVYLDAEEQDRVGEEPLEANFFWLCILSIKIVSSFSLLFVGSSFFRLFERAPLRAGAQASLGALPDNPKCPLRVCLV